MLKCTLAWMWASPASSEDCSCTLTHTTAQHISCIQTDFSEKPKLWVTPRGLCPSLGTLLTFCVLKNSSWVSAGCMYRTVHCISLLLSKGNSLLWWLAVVGHLWLQHRRSWKRFWLVALRSFTFFSCFLKQQPFPGVNPVFSALIKSPCSGLHC